MMEMLPDRPARRSFTLGVINGSLFRVSSVFIDPNTVLALFVATMTGSNAFVGLIAAVASLGRVLPQIFVASRISASQSKMRYYHISFAVRGPALLCMTGAVALTNGSPILVSALVIVTYAIFASGGGFAYIPFMEVVSDTLRPSQRSSFFALRAFFGLLLGMLGGYIVTMILSSPEKFPFPSNYMAILTLGTLFAFMAMASWSMVKEPVTRPDPEARSLRHTLGRAKEILSQDRVLRRYIIVRSIIALAGMSTPFYVLHATGSLGLGEGVAGLLIISMTIGGVMSNLLWGRIGDTRGTRVLMIVGPLLLACVPASALLSSLWRTQIAAMVTFGILGLANAGISIAVINYLLDHSETGSRPVYMASTQLFVSLLAAAPLLGGVIAEFLGYEPLFVISLAISVAAAILALGLPEPRGLAEERFRALLRIS